MRKIVARVEYKASSFVKAKAQRIYENNAEFAIAQPIGCLVNRRSKFDCRNRRIGFQFVNKYVSCSGIPISDENTQAASRVGQHIFLSVVKDKFHETQLYRIKQRPRKLTDYLASTILHISRQLRCKHGIPPWHAHGVTSNDYTASMSMSVFFFNTPHRHPLLGNVGRLPWRMSRETLRRQVPEAM